MKLTVSCPVEQVRLAPGISTHRHEKFEVEPLRIVRSPVGSNGAARKRYYYRAFFLAPAGVIDYRDKLITGQEINANIERKDNPHWQPPKEGWIGNTWNNEVKIPTA